MEKIGIDKICCFHPLGFYACWMVVLMWMTFSVVTWGFSSYQPLLDSLGLMGFGAIFLMIVGTFGTVSGKKEFLCNVYNRVAKDFKKLLLMESLILLLSLGLAFDMGFGSVNGHSPLSIDSWNGIMRSSAAVLFCICLAKSISKLILERYTGRIIILCTDVILLPNLLVLVVYSGYHDWAKLLVVFLVCHFLYTLYRIVSCKHMNDMKRTIPIICIKQCLAKIDDWIGCNHPIIFVLYKTFFILVICLATIVLLINILRFLFWWSLIWPWMD